MLNLGTVEILLIEKSNTTDFLHKKQSAIEAEKESRLLEYTNAVQKYTEAQVRFDWFMTNKPYETNTDWIKMKVQADNLCKLYIQQTNYEGQLSLHIDKVNDAWISNGGPENYNLNEARNQALNAQSTLLEKIVETQSNLVLLDAALFNISNAADAEATSKLEAAKSDVVKANLVLEGYPTSEDYFQDFSPVVVQKTLSDAEGKFSFSYPRDKPFTIFASAQRMILGKTETYYWLVDAPTGTGTAQILLSNNNLVYADPDGYFKVKPKEEQQHLETQ
jgi:hypothetical protein